MKHEAAWLAVCLDVFICGTVKPPVRYRLRVEGGGQRAASLPEHTIHRLVRFVGLAAGVKAMILLCKLAVCHAFDSEKVALAIGNGAYEHVPGMACSSVRPTTCCWWMRTGAAKCCSRARP